MPDVFISYSVKDEHIAQFVRTHLFNEGLNVFIASINILPGYRWESQIFKALRNSEWVFFLASRNALNSPNVEKEIIEAVKINKKLVPIMWDVEPSELPDWISAFQGLNLKGASYDGIATQITNLTHHVKEEKINGRFVGLVAIAVLFGLISILSD